MTAEPKVVPQAGRNVYLCTAVFGTEVLTFLNTSLRMRVYVHACVLKRGTEQSLVDLKVSQILANR